MKLLVSAMGGEVSLKLPFSLMHENAEPDLPTGIFPSPVRDPQIESRENPHKMGFSKNQGGENLSNRKDFKDISDVSKGDVTGDEVIENEGQRQLKETRKNMKGNIQEDVDLIERCEEAEET